MTVIQSRIGPPGTGKTTYVQNVVDESIGQFGAEAILLTSLTRAAAAVLNARRMPIPERAIGTLHAHAYRALATPPLAETPKALRAWNTYVRAHGWTWAVREVPETPDPDGEVLDERPPATVADQYATARAATVPRALWAQGVRDFAQVWETWKQAEGLYDWNDLLEIAAAEVSTAPGAPAVIVADEAQDLSALGLRLLNRWGARAERFLKVGDPYQGLYGWAGADPEGFRAGVPDGGEAILAQSYRVPQAVHRVAMRWLRDMPGYWPIAYQPTAAPGQVALHAATWKTPAPLVPLLEAEAAAGRTVMVLASCGYMLQPLLTALRAAGLAFYNPYRPKHGGWNPLTGAGHRTVERVLTYLRWDRGTWGDEARPWQRAEIPRWAEWLRADAFAGRGVKTAVLDALTELPAPEAAGEVTIEELLGWFPEAHVDALIESDLDWYARHVVGSHAASLHLPMTIARQRGGAALREPPRIIVGTIHSVKGGEADGVVVFPDLSGAAQREWASVQTRAGLYRLFYVAMTRSRDRLLLCRPAAPGAVPWPSLN